MTFTLPPLPYAEDALEPHISAETLQYHYQKHHQAYIDKLNNFIEDTEYAEMTLEQIIRSTSCGIFNQAAQVWNHSFYWQCLSPQGGGPADGPVAQAINASFGSFDHFVEEFTHAALSNFGSGWTWLVRHSDGSLSIINTSNADTPLTDEQLTPLLTVDVWEHAYYIDYRNRRPDYLQAFWQLINWDFVNQNYC